MHLDFVVRDLAAAVARAEAAGATREGEVRPWNSVARTADPFGHGFDLITPRNDA